MFNLFHRHNWSTPHHAHKRSEKDDKTPQRYIMVCYDCGAEREIMAPLEASSEVERRIEEARQTLQKITKVS